MVRFFVPAEELVGRELVLTGENAQHAKVRRLKAGEQVLKEIPLVAEESVPRLTFWQIFGRVLRKLAMVG